MGWASGKGQARPGQGLLEKAPRREGDALVAQWGKTQKVGLRATRRVVQQALSFINHYLTASTRHNSTGVIYYQSWAELHRAMTRI